MRTKQPKSSLRPGLRRSNYLVIAFLLFGSHSIAADKGVEVKAFGLLDTSANLSVRYLLDERDVGQSNSSGTFEDRLTWEEELWIKTRSYVYHPGFLNINFDLGPKFVQQNYDANAGSNRNNEDFLQFRARLNFLDLKRYPISLHYSRTNPSVAAGLSGRFLAEANEYGASLRLPSFMGASVNMEAGHRDNYGLGFGRVLDDATDSNSITVNYDYRDGDTLQLKQSQSDSRSSSGSPGLPIQESTIKQDNSHVLAMNRFGSAKNFILDQSYYRLSQVLGPTNPNQIDSTRYRSALRMMLAESVKSTLSFDSDNTVRSEATSSSKGLDWRLDHAILERLQYGFSAGRREIEQTGFESSVSLLDARVSYQLPTRVGTFSFGGNVRNARTDQASAADSIAVFDETVVLVGTVPFDLSNEFVISGSVVVSNVDRTQVFIEGADYRLVEIGSVTQIQRLINGNILDGETVLVDYEFQTSGTAEFETMGTGVNVSYGLGQYVSASLSFNQTDTELLEGEFTTPINDQATWDFNIRATLPEYGPWTFGGEYRHTDRDESISPSVTDSLSLHARAGLWQSLRVNVSAYYLRTDLEKSTEDTNEVIFRVGLSGAPLSRVNVAYDTSYARDIGGSLPRNSFLHRLSLNWRYRAVSFSLRAEVSDEKQGATDRRYKRVTAEVMRLF